jgi:hypothetical protein
MRLRDLAASPFDKLRVRTPIIRSGGGYTVNRLDVQITNLFGVFLDEGETQLGFASH